MAYKSYIFVYGCSSRGFLQYWKATYTGEECGDVFILSEEKRLLPNVILLLPTYQTVIVCVDVVALLRK